MSKFDSILGDNETSAPEPEPTAVEHLSVESRPNDQRIARFHALGVGQLGEQLHAPRQSFWPWSRAEEEWGMGGTLFDQPVSHVMTGMASITVNGIISLGLYFRVAANYIDPVMMKDLRKFLGWYTPTCRVYCVISEDEIRPLVGTRRLMDVSCLKTNRSMILQMGPMI